jgi:hypothetical protein
MFEPLGVRPDRLRQDRILDEAPAIGIQSADLIPHGFPPVLDAVPTSAPAAMPAGQESRPMAGAVVSRGAPNQRESASCSAGTSASAGSPAVAAQAM